MSVLSPLRAQLNTDALRSLLHRYGQLRCHGSLTRSTIASALVMMKSPDEPAVDTASCAVSHWAALEVRVLRVCPFVCLSVPEDLIVSSAVNCSVVYGTTESLVLLADCRLVRRIESVVLVQYKIIDFSRAGV